MPADSPVPISEADVRKIARLSRLAISDAEVAQNQKALSAVMAYMDALREVELSGAASAEGRGAAANPVAAAGGDELGSHLALDEPGETGDALSNEALMKIAPRTMPPFVLVPKVFEDGGGA